MSDMHTPLPWKLHRRSRPMTITGNIHQITDAEGQYPAAFVPAWDAPTAGEEDGSAEALANAELIVTAVNERPALLARTSQDAETIKALRDDRYDQGRRDVLNAILALNPKAEALLAGLHEREPNSMGQLPFDVVVWVTEVAEQLGIKPKDEDRAALAGRAS